jgi:hypothetical protein
MDTPAHFFLWLGRVAKVAALWQPACPCTTRRPPDVPTNPAGDFVLAKACSSGSTPAAAAGDCVQLHTFPADSRQLRSAPAPPAAASGGPGVRAEWRFCVQLHATPAAPARRRVCRRLARTAERFGVRRHVDLCVPPHTFCPGSACDRTRPRRALAHLPRRQSRAATHISGVRPPMFFAASAARKHQTDNHFRRRCSPGQTTQNPLKRNLSHKPRQPPSGVRSGLHPEEGRRSTVAQPPASALSTRPLQPL